MQLLQRFLGDSRIAGTHGWYFFVLPADHCLALILNLSITAPLLSLTACLPLLRFLIFNL